MTMLVSSTMYNLWPVSPRKWRLRRFDQAAIHLLIGARHMTKRGKLEYLLKLFGEVHAQIHDRAHRFFARAGRSPPGGNCARLGRARQEAEP